MRRATVAACIAIILACVGAAVTPSARAFVPNGPDGWFCQAPQPVASLTDVTFATATDVWAVGSGGAILHSANGGLTWAGQQSGTFADLSSVSFVDAEHGWTSATHQGSTSTGPGVVLATGDGGATWTDVTPTGLTRIITGVSFVDAEHGWAGASGGRVLRTTNGGATWATVRAGAATGALAVDFVSLTRGWASEPSAGRLWRTSDGGATWNLVRRFVGADRYRASSIDFTDATHGWAGAEDSQSNSVSVTADGGRTWRRVLRPSGYLTTVHATDATHAVVASVDLSTTPDDLSLATLVHLQYTSNGGRTWHDSRIGSHFWSVAVAGHGSRWCAAGSGLLTSQDDAATWASASSGQQYSLQQGLAVSATDLWAVDAAGALLHSADGARWVEQTQPQRWSQALTDVSFVGAQDGWIVGSEGSFDDVGVILHTSDGGATWSPQGSSLGAGLVGVDFVDAQDGWAISNDPWGMGAGANTAIERTTDGGVTWVPQWIPNNPGLTAVDFIDASTGWVAGDYYDDSATGMVRTILKTTNGGGSWVSHALPAGVRISSLQFLDASTGWAAGSKYTRTGEQGWLLHTTDGGATWTRITSISSNGLAAVRFLDAQHGWAAGDDVYATSDGGATWRQVAGDASAASIAALDSDHVWTFGDSILGTVDAGGGDLMAPDTYDDSDWGWHRAPVTVKLTPSDAGGSGLAGTEFKNPASAVWQSGTSVDVAAPGDHSNDGMHTFLYRSSDNAGTVEATEESAVGIDTLGPACSAPKAAVVNTGQTGIIRFKAADATSGVARATITIVGRGGRVVHRFTERPGNWSYGPPDVPYYWLRLKGTLSPGLYRIEVRAVDRAGNRQVRVGRNTLRVVSGGAPPARHPHWPAGLPDTTPQPQLSASGVAAADRILGAMGARDRAGHSARARELLLR